MKGSLAWHNHQRENQFMAASSLKGSLTLSCMFVIELQEYYSELLLSTWVNVLQSREVMDVQKSISNTIAVTVHSTVLSYTSLHSMTVTKPGSKVFQMKSLLMEYKLESWYHSPWICIAKWKRAAKKRKPWHRSLNIVISVKLDFGYCFLYCKFYEHNDILLGNFGLFFIVRFNTV